MFALNNALCAAVVLQAVKCVRATATRGEVAWGAFLAGLALTNQHTSVLFIIPLVGCIMWQRRRVRARAAQGRARARPH